MEDTTIFKAVNKCETLKELADVIRGLADEKGMIKGRSRQFDAERMAQKCENFNQPHVIPNNLTREFGIRQQAMYISYYNPQEGLDNPKLDKLKGDFPV